MANPITAIAGTLVSIFGALVIVSAVNSAQGNLGQGLGAAPVHITSKEMLKQEINERTSVDGIVDRMKDQDGKYSLWRILKVPADLVGDFIGLNINYLKNTATIQHKS